MLIALAALPAAACTATSGVIPIGPGTYTLSDMRAPALGGGPAAQGAALAHASAFCRAQGRAAVLLDGHPDGDPHTPYYPTAYDVTFGCR